MPHITAIEQLRTYLKKWFLASQPPQTFMEVVIECEEPTEIVHQLGTILYHHLTKEKFRRRLTPAPPIMIPRLYQFLNNVLHENPNERITEPEILLNLITSESRDRLEERRKERDHTTELYSTVGLTRSKNQDYAKTLLLKRGILVLMVADGMGGGEAGEIASRLVIDHLTTALKERPIDKEQIEEQLSEIIFEAHQTILDYSKAHHFKSMGTTLSMTLLFPDGTLYIAHVGDSRIYEMEESGELRQLSEDHSYPEVLFRLGKITEAEKSNYQKNIVVYILGKENLKKEEICIRKSYLYSDTELLLCSDGFWDMIPVNRETFTQPFEALKKRIFNQISVDNVTVIRYQPKKNQTRINDKGKEDERE